jgi:alkanesulfonate monooxygenase SsuD/methylene tetrahydromethanopterin reductase-like flavin-dependent oxidoreductase (luciferase family)
MELDLLIHTVDADPGEVVEMAVAAEQAGFSGVWLWDHLSGGSTDGAWNLECWTMLSAVAARTERIAIGSLVLNVANHDPGTTAVAAATLQALSGGRLLLGVGAGAGRTSAYARDQIGLVITPPSDAVRRSRLVDWIRRVKSVWNDRDGGFLRPDPPPPIIVGSFGPKMIGIAAAEADGVAVPLNGFDGGPAMEKLLAAFQAERGRVGHEAALRVVHSRWDSTHFDEPQWLPGSEARHRLQAVGVDRFVLQAKPSAAKAVLDVDRRLFAAEQ